MFEGFVAYLCWRKLSWRLKYLPQTSQENVTSGLLCVRSCIIRLYDFVNRRWQYLQMNSHFGRILRRKSDRQSSLSIRIIANIVLVIDSSSFFRSLFWFEVHRLFISRCFSLVIRVCACEIRFRHSRYLLFSSPNSFLWIFFCILLRILSTCVWCLLWWLRPLVSAIKRREKRFVNTTLFSTFGFVCIVNIEN